LAQVMLKSILGDVYFPLPFVVNTCEAEHE
jgi:hypothetical protein